MLRFSLPPAKRLQALPERRQSCQSEEKVTAHPGDCAQLAEDQMSGKKERHHPAHQGVNNARHDDTGPPRAIMDENGTDGFVAAGHAKISTTVRRMSR